mgnify:CR=1 FL=1
MKLTKATLKQIIKEELDNLSEEPESVEEAKKRPGMGGYTKDQLQALENLLEDHLMSKIEPPVDAKLKKMMMRMANKADTKNYQGKPTEDWEDNIVVIADDGMDGSAPRDFLTFEDALDLINDIRAAMGKGPYKELQPIP